MLHIAVLSVPGKPEVVGKFGQWRLLVPEIGAGDVFAT